jgi:hypothetical protein
MNLTPDEMMQCVRDQAAKSVGRFLTDKTINDVANTITQIVRQQACFVYPSIRSEGIKFETGSDNDVIPSNLYTTLLMMGIIPEYEKVKDQTSYTLEDGTVVEHKPHSADCMIKPVFPVEYVKATFTVNKEI